MNGIDLPPKQRVVYEAYLKLCDSGEPPTSTRISELTGIGPVSLPELMLALRHKKLIPAYNERYKHKEKKVDLLLAIKRFELENGVPAQACDLRKMLKVPLEYRHHLFRDLRRLEVAGYITSYKEGSRRYYKVRNLYLDRRTAMPKFIFRRRLAK